MLLCKFFGLVWKIQGWYMMYKGNQSIGAHMSHRCHLEHMQALEREQNEDGRCDNSRIFRKHVIFDIFVALK